MKSMIALLTASVLAACVGPGVAAASPAVTLYGTYRVTLKTSDPDVPNGLWTLKLRPGHYSLGVARGFTNTGTLSVTGTVVTFTREGAPGCSSGRYHWRLSAATLRLSVIGRDRCSGNDRQVVLTSEAWTKQPPARKTLGTSRADVQPGVNLVPDAGFESPLCPNPQACPWYAYAGGTIGQTGPPHSGSWSLGVYPDRGQWYEDVHSACVQASPGGYFLSFWYYRPSYAAPPLYRVHFYPSGACTGEPVGTPADLYGNATDRWAQNVGSGTAPSGTQSGQVVLEAGCAVPCSGTEAIGYDDVVLALSQPTAVTLQSFSATRRTDGILLRWQTRAEAGTLGFNLYRRAGAALVKLNPALLTVTRPGSAGGANYRFLDRGADAAGALGYGIQLVRLDGASTFVSVDVHGVATRPEPHSSAACKPKLTRRMVTYCGPAAAGSPQVKISLTGIHPSDADFHQGTFTAPAPLCPAGSWIGNGGGARVFTCSDGSGTFTATFSGELEHVAGASGPWQITLGTGKYTTLRGKGTGTIDSSTGPNASPVVFADTWTGVADFDATAPSGAITAVKIERPHTLKGRWTLRTTFAARDNVEGNPVAFRATATAGSFFGQKNGDVTAGAASFTVAFRPAAATKRMEIAIELEDPVGNRSPLHRNVSLR